MRWLRPTMSHDTLEEAVDDVAAALAAAAAEAPPSQRAEEIREAVLLEVTNGRRTSPALAPLALAVAIVGLALLVGIGGPAIGSWIGERIELAPPSSDRDDEASEAAPSVTELSQNDDPSVPTQDPRASASPLPQAAEPPTDAASATDAAAPAGPAAPAPAPAPSDSGPPQGPPAGPPDPLPTPPGGGSLPGPP